MPKANEHIVVVGGTSGIGLALAQAAHALGCNLTVAGRGAERAAAIAKSIGARATGCHIDLEDVNSIQAGLADGPPIDHLVLLPIYSATTVVKEAVHAALPRLKPTSSIVLFGGTAKSRPYPTSTMLTVANAGVVGVMKTLAVELAPIRVNAVSPGVVGDSPKWDAMVKAGDDPVLKALAARTPTRRLATMADVIGAVFFLLDNQSVNGHDLEIDGGSQLV
jgi:NAD(P)-dependent dehydrogenase (short-subunit alcohol dehydrogenase family)